MDSMLTFVLYAFILVVVSMAGACIPHVRKLKDSQVHLLVALSTGIFLGLLFLMLLPEALEELEHGGFDMHEGMYAILGGFVLIMLIDMVMKHSRAADVLDRLGNSYISDLTQLIHQFKVTHCIILCVTGIHNASGKLKGTCR